MATITKEGQGEKSDITLLSSKVFEVLSGISAAEAEMVLNTVKVLLPAHSYVQLLKDETLNHHN